MHWPLWHVYPVRQLGKHSAAVGALTAVAGALGAAGAGVCALAADVAANTTLKAPKNRPTSLDMGGIKVKDVCYVKPGYRSNV